MVDFLAEKFAELATSIHGLTWLAIPVAMWQIFLPQVLQTKFFTICSMYPLKDKDSQSKTCLKDLVSQLLKLGKDG